VAKTVKSLRIPQYVYLFARNFGTGVIVATAFVHLMDPAYGEIGPNTLCWPLARLVFLVKLLHRTSSCDRDEVS
jgi:hypothetical protein